MLENKSYGNTIAQGDLNLNFILTKEQESYIGRTQKNRFNLFGKFSEEAMALEEGGSPTHNLEIYFLFRQLL
jgi:hypothetical protein